MYVPIFVKRKMYKLVICNVSRDAADIVIFVFSNKDVID